MTAIGESLTALETRLAGLLSLQAGERRTLAKMGDKSEAFCRQTLTVLAQNLQVVPPSLNLPEALADLAALDRLRPILARLQRLHERAEDTEMALGSDIMGTSLEGYALLKVTGKNQGLEELRRGLSQRFSRRTAAPATTPPAESLS